MTWFTLLKRPPAGRRSALVQKDVSAALASRVGEFTERTRISLRALNEAVATRGVVGHTDSCLRGSS